MKHVSGGKKRNSLPAIWLSGPILLAFFAVLLALPPSPATSAEWWQIQLRRERIESLLFVLCVVLPPLLHAAIVRFRTKIRPTPQLFAGSLITAGLSVFALSYFIPEPPLVAVLLALAAALLIPPSAKIQYTITPRPRGWHCTTATLALLVYFAAYWPRLSGRFDLFHEGEQLVPLLVANQGGNPYSDVWIQHGLIKSLLLPWLGSALFSNSVAGVRHIERLFEPLGYVAFFILCLYTLRLRRLHALFLFFVVSGAGFWISFRPSALLLCVAAHSAGLRLLFQMGTVSKIKLFCLAVASGFSAMLSILISLDFGIYALVGSTAWFFFVLSTPVLPNHLRIYTARTAVPGFVIGCFALFIPVTIWLWSISSLAAAHEAIIQQLSLQLGIWGLGFPPLSELAAFLRSGTAWNDPAQNVVLLVYLTPFIYLLCGIYLAGALRQSNLTLVQARTLLLLCFAVPMFQTALGRTDHGHWIDSASLFWLLIILPWDSAIASLLQSYRRRAGTVRPRTLLAAGIGMLSCTFMCLLTSPLQTGWNNIAKRVAVWKTPQSQQPSAVLKLGKMEIPPEQLQVLKPLLAEIEARTPPGSCIYDLSNQPALYFLADRRPASRYFSPVYTPTAELQRQVIAGIEDCQAQLVVVKTNSAFDAIDGISTEERAPLLFQYISENFRERIIVEGIELAMRTGR